MFNRSYLAQFFEFEGPAFGSGQPWYIPVGLCNYLTNWRRRKNFRFSEPQTHSRPNIEILKKTEVD